jgi:hypothetical protein
MKKSKAKYIHKKPKNGLGLKQADKRSIRTIKRGKHKIRIGCPKGHYDTMTETCAVGTRAISILHPKTEKNPSSCKYNLGGKVTKHKRTKHLKRKTNRCGNVSISRKELNRLLRAATTKRRKPRRRNVEMGFRDATGFHPIRASADYSRAIAGEGRPTLRSMAGEAKRTHRKKRAGAFLKKHYGHKRNIPLYLASNPGKLEVIYPKVEKIYATKTSGPNKGRYVHNVKAEQMLLGIASGPLKGSAILTDNKKLIKKALGGK